MGATSYDHQPVSHTPGSMRSVVQTADVQSAQWWVGEVAAAVWLLLFLSYKWRFIYGRCYSYAVNGWLFVQQ